jgi:uncharacterized membrane protein
MPDADVVDAIDEYCNRLRNALHKVPSPERDEIVREVRGHIFERVEAEPVVTKPVLTGILRAVGDPKELASEYRTQAALRQATSSRSPWVLLGATLRWAATSAVGVLAFLATMIGYGCAMVFFLCAFLKPIFPSRIGLWLAPHHTVCFGYWNGPSREQNSTESPCALRLSYSAPLDPPMDLFETFSVLG